MCDLLLPPGIKGLKFISTMAEIRDQSHYPANIHLDEDVLKTSFVFVSSRRIHSPYSYVFRRRLEDVLIKTNIFVLVIRLQDVLPRRLQNVFKTFWRRLLDVLKTFSKRFQDIFKTSSWRFEDVFKTFSRRIIKLNCCC